jgi:acyl carrier protein
MSSRNWSTEIIAIFRDVLAIEVPSPDADVIEAGLLDSLALVTLIFELEQRTGVDMPLESLDLDDLRTVHRMAGVLERLEAEVA